MIVFVAALSVTPVYGQVPAANFTASPLSGCSPLIVNFQDLSSGNPAEWHWEFGNGNSSALQNPSATYFIPGTYSVSLTVTNESGTNTLLRQQYITVYETPTIDFSADKRLGCFPLHVQFTDLSTAGAGNTNISWVWDFGNGVTSTEQNPSVTYTIAGNYNVTLRITNDKGCTKAITRPAYISATPGVTAGFTNTQPSVCSAPATITFVNTSTGPGTLTYLWNWGDGTTSTTTDGTYTYTSNGTYSVTLIATSSAGCEDTAGTSIIIGEPVTSFENTAAACANTPITFTNTSTPVPVSSQWYFGDGGSSTQLSPAHTYANPGTYTVRLYNNYTICTDSVIRTITVNPLPAANFNTPNTIRCEPPFTVNFQNTSTGSVSWQWDFGDGNISTEQNPSHTYSDYGNYTVTLIAVSSNGCSNTISKPEFIKIQRTSIDIPDLPGKGCVPFTMNFTPAITSLDAITSYQWDFGDGGTSTQQNPTHTYTVQGTYTVRLIVTSSTGCTDSLVVPDAIKVGTKPAADFSANPTTVCAFTGVQFSHLTPPPVDEWDWDFGDGTSSGAPNPLHEYSDTGTFDIRLIVINNGCADTIIKENYIRVLAPIAKFKFAANCNNRLQFTFTDQSTGPVSWLWDFGDGTTSTVQNPVHNFPALGSYNVKLTVTNGSCSHSVTHTVYPTQQSPDFSGPSVICHGNPATFTPLNVSPALTASLLWRFGTGAQVTSGVQPVTYTYNNSGNYNVTLVAIDINGCRDSIIKTNYIRVNGPVANFTVTNGEGCTGITTTFNDQSSTDGIHNIVSWQWNFGDDTIRTYSSPPFQHTYNTTDTFTVKLVITDASGCADSITKPDIIVTTDPVADFNSDTASCPGADIRFTNTSLAAGFTSAWDFGDGNTSTANSPTHSYTDTGFYTIKLVITDKYGCTDSVIKNKHVHVSRPVASFTVNDSISSCIPFEVRFTNTSSFTSSVLWDFGAGEGISDLNEPVHYYSVPGTYTVRLLATSPGGCRDSTFMTITLNDTVGAVINYSPVGGCNPLSVNLDIEVPGIMESYFWDFGDGSVITTDTPFISHIYTSFGNFLPKVILMDPSGCLIPLTGADTIHIIGSNPNFGFVPALLCDSGFVVFSDSTTSSDPITNWNWDFGDGGTSTDQNPGHYYTAPGIYDITLNIATQSGCTNSITLSEVKVVESPLIDISGDTAICINDSILHAGIFIRQDTSVVSWSWIFPNGNTSAIQNPPVQVYNSAGNFTVTAIATNSSGCKDSATKNIIVHPLPTVTMPGQITTQVGFAVTIPATYSAGVNSWNWTPANGLSCTDCATPDASPQFNTAYLVEFSDVAGCRNTGTIEVIVICKDANIFIPNTFSPNSDGSNDRFYPRGRGIYLIKTFQVFSRWGELVFENRNFQVNDAAQGWDGKYKGQRATPDVYVYQIELICDNGEPIKLEGNIALIL